MYSQVLVMHIISKYFKCISLERLRKHVSVNNLRTEIWKKIFIIRSDGGSSKLRRSYVLICKGNPWGFLSRKLSTKHSLSEFINIILQRTFVKKYQTLDKQDFTMTKIYLTKKEMYSYNFDNCGFSLSERGVFWITWRYSDSTERYTEKHFLRQYFKACTLLFTTNFNISSVYALVFPVTSFPKVFRGYIFLNKSTMKQNVM